MADHVGVDMTDATTACPVQSCDRPLRRGGYCYGHYMKNWRYGTPTPEFAPSWVDIRGRRFGSLVVIRRVANKWECQCDCGRTTHVLAGCLNRGGTRTCGDHATHHRAEVVSYSAAHDRCRRDRGLPGEHECVDCGRPAKHWSYNHDDPDELVGTTGWWTGQVAYSADPWHYSPRCVPCHKRFDLGRATATRPE